MHGPQRFSDYLTVSQAAEFLGVSVWTVRNWDRVGKISSTRHPNNHYRMYRVDDLQSMLEKTALSNRNVSARKEVGRRFYWRRRKSIGPQEREVSQARLAAIVESSDDAIISKTLGGIITSWNQSAERLFGYTASEAVGQHITLIIPKERLNEESAIIEKIRRGQRVTHFETQRVAKSGQLVDVFLTVSPLRASDGTLIGASKIARDITEKKRLEAQRNEVFERECLLRSEAQRINILKDEFLATLSHELRTPLNAILGWSQMLMRGNIDEAGIKQAAQVLNRSATIQKKLIDDLLDMSRIISGKLRVQIGEVDPVMLVNDAVETVKASADAKRISINVRIEPEVGIIFGDHHRLQQVLCNLLTNSVKFTPADGSICICFARVKSDIQISVSDTGQGISPEFMPYIFERFRQSDATMTRTHGGLGLGLSIVKQLIDLHGGSIRAESGGEGKGATFIITLPTLAIKPRQHEVVISAPTGKVPPPCEFQRVDLRGIKILLVEDDADSRELIRIILDECEAEVIAAESAQAALVHLEHTLPDIILSDIGMPGMDGYEFLRRVRGFVNGAERVPAVAITAFARNEDRNRVLRGGFIAHIPKPADPAEVLGIIAGLVGRKKN